MDQEPEKKKKKGNKPTAEVLQKRKEGRLKAAATIASNLKKTGILRVEEQNGFPLTNIKPIPLINQKNYFTEYLKRDDQIGFIRNWRREKLLKQKLKKLQQQKPDTNDEGPKNFDDFNLNDIEEEMKKQKDDNVNDDEDDEDEDDDDENVDAEEQDAEGAEISHTEKARIGSDVIVIQPGSSYFRIGKATDAAPLVIPTVVAIKKPTTVDDYMPPAPIRTETEDGEVSFGEEFEAVKGEMTKDFKARMRFYKRRVLPNSRETASNFNKKQEPEIIPEHNDPYKKEWIDLKEYPEAKVFVGEDALNLPICEKFQEWKLRYPMLNGKFNEGKEYSSKQELLGDLTNIVQYALNKLDIKQPKLFKCVLLIPDLYDKMVVENLMEMLFRLVGFGRVGIIQESVAASFGAGTSSACIIDVGSQTTTISCVDEGLVINDSRIKLNFGGDNITETFSKFLLQQHFPDKELNMNYNYDWEMIENLKKDFVTFQDADIAVQIYNFFKRKPFENTKKYEFKVFDEVMLSPLGLFFPKIFDIKMNNSYRLFSRSLDHYSMKCHNPYSQSQVNVAERKMFTDVTDEQLLYKLNEGIKTLKTANPFSKAKFTNHDINEKELSIPLEKAIIESITNAGLATEFSKVRKFYDNLLFVGGGLSKIDGYDMLITDRINIWRPKFLSTSNTEEIFSYISNQETKVEFKQRKLVAEALAAKGMKPDEELPEEDMAEIENQCQLSFDLDYIDSIVDKGQLLPVTVLPPPREFDPRDLTWKGGSVYGRLKVVNEMWISNEDWQLMETRSLYYKSLFNY